MSQESSLTLVLTARSKLGFCSVFINKPCGKCCPSERSLSQLPFFANCSCSLMVMSNPSGLHHKQQVYTFIPHFIYYLLFLKYLIVEILACRLKVLSLLFWPDGENVTEEQQTVILRCIPLSLLSLKDLCLLSVCLLLYRRCKKAHFSRTLIMHSQGSQNFKIPGSPSGRYSSDFGSPKISLTSPNKKKDHKCQSKTFSIHKYQGKSFILLFTGNVPSIFFSCWAKLFSIGWTFWEKTFFIPDLYSAHTKKCETFNFNVLFIFDLTLDVIKWCAF